MQHDVVVRPLLVEPAGEGPPPLGVGSAHVQLNEGAGQLLRFPRRGSLAGRQADDRIADARKEKESAIDAQDFEKAASLRDKEKQLVAERAEREKQWRSGDMDVVAEVDDEQIAEVLGNWTGIPVFKLTEEETTRLLRMEDELHKRIIGQEDAVKAVSKAIRRTRAGDAWDRTQAESCGVPAPAVSLTADGRRAVGLGIPTLRPA